MVSEASPSPTRLAHGNGREQCSGDEVPCVRSKPFSSPARAGFLAGLALPSREGLSEQGPRVLPRSEPRRAPNIPSAITSPTGGGGPSK